MKKFIICLFFSLVSFNLFATITKDDIESFYSKSDGCVIIENDYYIFPGYTVYGKESIYKIFVAHDGNGNAYCFLYITNKSSIDKISVTKSYYDKEKNIFHLYKVL